MTEEEQSNLSERVRRLFSTKNASAEEIMGCLAKAIYTQGYMDGKTDKSITTTPQKKSGGAKALLVRGI